MYFFALLGLLGLYINIIILYVFYLCPYTGISLYARRVKNLMQLSNICTELMLQAKWHIT